MTKIFDCIIVGAGPAGLSAAIYLARYNRSVLVFDTGEGRSTYPQHNENYLGFPKGIAAQELRKRGRLQADRFNVQFINREVVVIKRSNNSKHHFSIRDTSQQIYLSKSIILATGVVDIFPIFEKYEQFIGKSLFWCLTCDGYKSIKKKIAVVGNDEQAAINALQFLNFTSDITLITNCVQEYTVLSKKMRVLLIKKGIRLVDAAIVAVTGSLGVVEKIILSNGSAVNCDLIFSHQGSNPNCKLAAELGLKLTDQGYISIDEQQRTSIPGIFAAGDITRVHSHQIIAAAHEGAIAAQTINYDLYEPFQRL